MCVFKAPAIPGPDPAVEAERQERMAQEMADARQRKQEALEGEITRRKKGRAHAPCFLVRAVVLDFTTQTGMSNARLGKELPPTVRES